MWLSVFMMVGIQFSLFKLIENLEILTYPFKGREGECGMKKEEGW